MFTECHGISTNNIVELGPFKISGFGLDLACDNCTLTLLDSVEALTSELRTKADPTELSRIPKPFAALREFSRNTTALQSSLNHLKNNLEHSKNLEDRLGQLEDMEHRVFTEANALKSEAKRREKEADYLSLESMSALEEVLKIRRQISEQVEALDEFARGEKHLSAHRALKEAKHLLRQIKDLKLIDYVTGANDVFDAAHLQSTSVQERNYRLQDTYRRLSSLRSALDTWELKAADLQKLAETVWKADDTVTALKELVKPRLAAVRDIGLRCRLVLEDITTLSANNITDEIRSSLLQAQTLGIKFPTLAAELAVLTLAAEEKEGILYNLTPVYKQKYLEAVEKHVTELGVKAKEYKSLFAGSRAAASLGVSAAQAWSHVATQVKEAAAAADAASKAAAAATLTSASNSSAASAGSLQPSQLWLGWPGGGAGLPACVHALYTDDRTVGLWNFVQQPKEAQCTGCTQRWYSGRGDEPSMVWFNGAGYVELVRSRARPADRRQFSVAFTFRTRDEDALLFMALDTANNRSVSVTLRECRVVFTVEYGGSRLQITAAGRHCGGRPAHVQAIRVFASNKLEKGNTLRSAILKGTGYIELPSPLIRRKASLGISFRTHTPDGLLLYRPPAVDNELADDGDKHYFALVMKAGELELVADAGKGEMRLRTNGTRFDDGRLHTVRIIRMHKQLELWVDEEQLGSGSLPGSAFPARPAGMFLGGVRETLQAVVPLTAFKGTLADFIVDAQLIGLQTAISWSGAALGRADGSHTRPPRAEPRALHQQPDHAGCTKTSSYTVEAGAVKFGDTAHSHAHLRLPRSPARRRDLTLSLQIRTFATDGLLLLAPGSKGKPKQFMALVLRESKLRLVVRNRKRKEISLAANVSDGNWRQVSIRVSRNRVQLSSEGAAVTARTQAAARAHRLYVGGLPAPPALPHLPNWITLVRGFLGCIRRVSVNGRAEDLVRDAQAHHGVGQCFPNVERAAYFGGDAYATWSSSWQLAAGAEELRLQFRTSEPDGVLLAAAGLLLEIKDGAVVLSRSSGGSERSRIAWRAAGGGACDGAWHSVRARLRPALALQLDDNELLRDSPPTALLDAPDAPPPTQLYIAGLPEGVMETTDGGKNFNGCIRDVVIGGQKKDWKEMESLHNVLLDSCPIPQ
ncbi:hypothetical protein B5X24_HaOG203609 [Helicoverpa armigera]|uniref:Laminin G domain-containing protein n=1 Tax=Helicoverpa armigera TaxID=29058 RepID=A0A2W1BQ67_HELAM|nr:hypothetical protein B5X24_HaOG203609 [Helicoverpa armigera]